VGEEMSEWIKCEDRLPVTGENGLCALREFNEADGRMIVVPFTFLDDEFHPYVDADGMEEHDYWTDALYWPTHWMPMPIFKGPAQ
jgi:hypothetical protein